MGNLAPVVCLADIEREELESLASARRTAQVSAPRARAVWLAAQGVDNLTICARLPASPNAAGK
jgi:hypothetical protein